MRKSLLSLFVLLSLVFIVSSCVNAEIVVGSRSDERGGSLSETESSLADETLTETESGAPASSEEVPSSETDGGSENPPPVTTTRVPVTTTRVPVSTEDVAPPHVHTLTLSFEKKETCTAAGEKVYSCDCGYRETHAIPAKGHSAGAASCTEASVCSRCRTQLSAPLGHQVDGGVCKRCGITIKSPIFVLGQSLDYDQKIGSITEKLGTPTAIIEEGDIVSLIYASDLLRLTVIQTDTNGLWGVFTMDPDARILADGKELSITNFSGSKDVNSDAYYRDAGTCRIFGFRDSLQGGEYYALWMRYSECRYDYMNDSRLYGNFSGQNLLSYYYVNALRAKNGLSPLLWSDAASAVATEYSAYMIENNFFNHDGSYGTRLNQKGIFWNSAGENISQGYFNAFFVCDAYFNSSGHRSNILGSSYTHVGMGYCRRAEPTSVFGAQIFYGKQ